MFVAAAMDLGVPREVIARAIDALGVPIEWEVERVVRGGVTAQKVTVLKNHDHDQARDHDHDHEQAMDHGHHHHHDHHHRHYRDIRPMLDRLPSGVAQRARAIFDRIADVEARIHNVAREDVAFHEVGAIDSIFDIVAAAAALDWLAPARVTCSRVAVGAGTVATQHGRLPVPAPATVALLLGAPVEAGGPPFELTTPTGAAILSTQVDAWQDLPPMVLRKIGYGAGTRELPDRPNVVRLLTGDPAEPACKGEPAQVLVLTANIDDMSPELAEPLMDALFAAGALDVWFTPIHMKKNRPAFQASALAPVPAERACADVFLRESSTLGVRVSHAHRHTLDRVTRQVDTAYGRVAVKVGLQAGEVVQLAPEYDSVRQAARSARVPVKQVFEAALAAASTLRTQANAIDE
jgi:uncharacterized protein (TIGR00299 family) protein